MARQNFSEIETHSFVIFGIEIISAKAAHKMMAKLRTGLNFTNAV